MLAPIRAAEDARRTSERFHAKMRLYECERKRQYHERGHAEQVAAKVAAERGVDGLQVYECRHCGHYHIGHPVKREGEI
jgi:rubrerythrin